MSLLYNGAINALRRNVFDPLYYHLINSSRPGYWRKLEKTQYLPEKELKVIQWQRLCSLLNYAWLNNDFYRNRFDKAGVSPADITCPDDMRKLPILTKADIREQNQKIISRGFDIETLLKMKTGGSTGRSLEVYLTEECSERRNACARRHDRWSGWELGEPIAAVWGNPYIPSTLKGKLKEWIVSPIIYLDTMCLNRQAVEVFAEQWDIVKPTLLFGHAHSIFMLAQQVSELGIENIRPRGIISSSMMLLAHERTVIEDVFKVRVTNRYGCEEVSLIASECECHNGMHLNIEHLFIEFIKDDGSPSKPGEPGKIVVTDLYNQAIPLIRYQVEDIGVPTERKCDCGRGLPLMEGVVGRVADFLRKRDGSQVAGISLIENTLTKYPGLDQMQIVQNDFEDIYIRLVVGKAFKDDTLIELTMFFKKIFGINLKLEFDLVDAIKPEQSGKYRFTICKIN
jgi:phenylacetate-CoA ligase